MQELGYTDFDVTGYFGLLFPAMTPQDRIERLYTESRKALDAPEVKMVIEAAGMYPVGSTPAEFAKFLEEDFTYQGRLMRELGLSAK